MWQVLVLNEILALTGVVIEWVSFPTNQTFK